MARMSIDDKFLRDPRVILLADELGINLYDARGRLLGVFALCYDVERHTIVEVHIDRAADRKGFAAAMVNADLATRHRNGIRVRGAEERIDYLQRKRDAGRTGGLNSAKSRADVPKHLGQAPPPPGAQAPGNPPDPVPDLVPDPSPDPVPDQNKNPHTPKGGGRSRSKPGKGEPTSAELASVRVVLDRLGAQNGVSYSMARRHVALIVRQLREGITELELRAVVAYCADPESSGGLGWRGSPKMHKHLCPETLFGPETIARYLDPARAVFQDLIAQHATPPAQPQLALIRGGIGEAG